MTGHVELVLTKPDGTSLQLIPISAGQDVTVSPGMAQGVMFGTVVPPIIGVVLDQIGAWRALATLSSGVAYTRRGFSLRVPRGDLLGIHPRRR
jgi:hypothetical protein